MKITTQKSLSERLGIDPALFSKMLKGKKRLTASKAARVEHITGIGIRIWLFGKPEEIRRELERVYGRINFKRGRLPGKREAKK
jgi:transcriptional regulator with XRE-family HTH domain